MNIYSFPQHASRFSSVSGRKQLVSMFQRIHEKQLLQNTFVVTSTSKWIVSKCQVPDCPATIRFKKQNQSKLYVLVSFQAEHWHPKRIQKKKIVQKFINKLPPYLQQNQQRQIVHKKFGVDLDVAGYWLKRINASWHKICNLFKKLSQYKYQYYHPRKQQNMENVDAEIQRYHRIAESERFDYLGYLVIMTDSMKKNSSLCQSCSITVVPQLIKDSYMTTNNEVVQVKWDLIIFLVQDAWRQALPAGIAFIIHQKEQYYFNALEILVKITMVQPKCLIVQSSSYIQQILKKMKANGLYSGQYLIDPSSLLKKYREKLQDPTNVKYLDEIIRSVHEQQITNCILKNLPQITKNEHDMKIIYTFLQQAHHYAFSLLPKTFIGVRGCYMLDKDLPLKIKQRIETRNGFGSDAMKTISFLQQLTMDRSGKLGQIRRDKGKIWEQFPTLHQYYRRLEPQVFQTLKSQYLFVAVAQQKQIAEYPQRIFRINFNDQIYYVKFSEEFNRYICDCGWMEKTGLPCIHLMKVFFNRFGNISRYVYPRWLTDKTIDDLSRRFSYRNIQTNKPQPLDFQKMLQQKTQFIANMPINDNNYLGRRRRVSQKASKEMLEQIIEKMHNFQPTKALQINYDDKDTFDSYDNYMI